jgi:omega-amidase
MSSTQSSTRLPVVLVQPDMAWEDRTANQNRYLNLLQNTPPGSLVILPEMCEVGFTMNPAPGLDIDHASRTFFSRLARQTRSHIIAGLILPSPTKPTNSAVVFDPQGQIISQYDKQKPFSPAGEHLHYSAGSSAVVVPMLGTRVGLSICYDLRFPELYREQIDLNAEVLVVIANWPSRRLEQKIALLRARAIENQAFVVVVNRTGKDPTLEYPGRSMIIDPFGDIIADAGTQETVLAHTIDLHVVREWRSTFPALRDR